MSRDFTLAKYAQLCETLQDLSCPVMTVSHFLAAGQPENRAVVLRHDVDRHVGAALRMARLESECGLASTYYFRATPVVFVPEALVEVRRLGHEVGYHYEVLAKARGNTEEAIRLFEQELERFREIVPVDTVSMHGSPLSPWNNLGLWRVYDFAHYGILGDAVLGIDGERLYYFTDTGRSWDASRYNLRDHVASREPRCQVHTTDDLIDFLNERPDCPVYLSAHPGRWASNWLQWSVGLVSDWTTNRTKQAASLLRANCN
jgi:hypothetical protein